MGWQFLSLYILMSLSGQSSHPSWLHGYIFSKVSGPVLFPGGKTLTVASGGSVLINKNIIYNNVNAPRRLKDAQLSNLLEGENTMTLIDLTADQVLTTTRSVRKRLDLTRPVEPEVLRECLEIALQAPSGSNSQQWHFVIVTDPAKKLALADLYRKSFSAYSAKRMEARKNQDTSSPGAATQQRITNSADYLAEHMHEVPVYLIPCITGRLDNLPASQVAGAWGSIIPATWSFMLAARARGLGTAWTTLHLPYEKEAAEVLGIPYEKITQAALIPVAYTLGTNFNPAAREPLDTVLHWDKW
jgi:nitroreductase